VRLPGNVQHVMRVALERLQELAAGHLEDLDLPIGPAAGQPGAVRTEGQAIDGVAVAILGVGHDLAGGRVNELDRAVHRPRAAARLPSRANASATTRSVKPLTLYLRPFVCVSQTFTSWKLPLARTLPSGLKASDSIRAGWAARLSPSASART